MDTLPDSETLVTVGVDTHGDQHVAVALDQLGRHLRATEIPTTRAGYAELVAWATQFGALDRFGVEGTGSFGAGLARWLRHQGLVVIEIDRPDRKARRRGKSDLIDADAAARAVLSGTATTVPKRADGNVEMIRVLRVARRSAVKAPRRRCSWLLATTRTGCGPKAHSRTSPELRRWTPHQASSDDTVSIGAATEKQTARCT